MIYYRARWFGSRIGRFISEDWIGFAAGDAKLSRDVGNSTPNVVDPSGFYSESGHFCTTYFVGRINDMTHADARELAIYSQLPDEVFAYDAGIRSDDLCEFHAGQVSSMASIL